MFIMSGKANISLTKGGQFSAYFFEAIEGMAGQDRIFVTYQGHYLPDTTAYREGLASWTEKAIPAGSNHSDQQEAVQAQLSIELLVKEITSDGSIKMSALEDWKSANQTAWDNRKVLGLQ